MKRAYKNKLSLCMIVKNEAHNLRDCIEPLKPILDEIIVVDTGSTDGTREVAKSLGAKVFDFAWCDDFSAARNESLRHATGDYILWLDADDRVDDKDVKKIGCLKKNFPSKKNKSYYLIIKSVSPIDGETTFLQIRIFPNINGIKFEGRVHEQISHNLRKLGIELINTDIIIRHQGYDQPKSIDLKISRNLSILLKELESAPENPITHYHLGRTYFLLGENHHAINHMKKIFENDEIRRKEKQLFFDASILLGEFYMASKNYKEAFAVYKVLQRDYGNNILIKIGLGEVLYYLEHFQEAIEELENSFSYSFSAGLFPLNIEWNEFYRLYLLSQCYKKIGDIEKSKSLFNQLEYEIPYLYKKLERLGFLCLKRGEFEEAAEIYEKVLKYKNDSDEILTNLGLSLKKIKNFNQAEVSFKKALEINPNRIEALANLGYLYYEMKDFLKATEYFLKALRINPDLDDLRLILSEIYFIQLDLDEMVKQCECLLNRLGVSYKKIINNFQELSLIYKKIGKEYEKKEIIFLSLLAYKICFLVHPSEEILEKIICNSKKMGNLEDSLEKVKDYLEFHKGTFKFFPFLVDKYCGKGPDLN